MKKVAALLLFLGVLVTFGCVSNAAMKRNFAVGNVPCRVADIEADDSAPATSMASTSFDVGCAGKQYVCSRTCTSYQGLVCSNATTQCMVLADQSAPPTPAPAVAPAERPASVRQVSAEGEEGCPPYKPDCHKRN